MTTPMKLLMAIPDGVGVRNFALGRFLEHLQPAEQATVLADQLRALARGLRERPA